MYITIICFDLSQDKAVMKMSRSRMMMSLYGLVKLFRVTLSLSRSDALGRERTDHEAFCEEIVDIDGACLHIRHLVSSFTLTKLLRVYWHYRSTFKPSKSMCSDGPITTNRAKYQPVIPGPNAGRPTRTMDLVANWFICHSSIWQQPHWKHILLWVHNQELFITRFYRRSQLTRLMLTSFVTGRRHIFEQSLYENLIYLTFSIYYLVRFPTNMNIYCCFDHMITYNQDWLSHHIVIYISSGWYILLCFIIEEKSSTVFCSCWCQRDYMRSVELKIEPSSGQLFSNKTKGTISAHI